ncbi:MAG: UDP-N-acetylglucosamine 4,6-dehydratase (inverting) [Defluviitaleaceae bacterium]|nr:UDP-N-acetylglucosamine 4,6-dehydratase (inverting) [Defluviitaleaceae bacterium]
MLNDKVILVTGGTGSFGRQFVDMTIRRYRPKKLIVYSRDEYKQDILSREIDEKFRGNKCMRWFIGDVRDKDRLYRAFNEVDYVVHAAAMKQVPTCEYNPFEAVKTNIHGAQNVIDAAINCGVKKVVALSTDKAVNPINLYGGTKLVSDRLFISSNSYSGGKGTVFSVVRYGNVAGSRGSVIPTFKELLDRGAKTLPITNLSMTRFWITLEQGVELVYNALEDSKGGETYISKIPSFKISDLARAMAPGCELEEIGVREGEKLHEIMITRDDAAWTVEYGDHYVIYPNFNWWSGKNEMTKGGVPVVPGFEYTSDGNVDWLDIPALKKSFKHALERELKLYR